MVEFPTGSKNMANLKEVAFEIGRRAIRVFEKEDGTRAVYGAKDSFYNSNERFTQYPLFYEYFHGDNGAGVGASHQTGWTGLCTDILSRIAHEDSLGAKK
jgi:hypothetical protein